MNRLFTPFKFFTRLVTKWAAQRVLVGRNRSRREPERGRFTQPEVNHLLNQTWHIFDNVVPDVSKEPTIGSRLNVRLAALTLAFLHALTTAGIEREYAIELIGDTCWQIYQYWGYLGRFLGGVFPQKGDPAQRVRPDGTWPIMFPFNYPGYIAQYVPTEKGIGFDMIRCPVAAYFQAHGASDLAVSTWCSLDYAIAEIVGRKLVRTQTLAAGDGCCDFRWSPVDATQ